MIIEVGKKKYATNIEIFLLNLQNANTKKPNKIQIKNLRFVGLKKSLLEETNANNTNDNPRYPQVLLIEILSQDLFFIKCKSKKQNTNINGMSSKLIPKKSNPKLGRIKVDRASKIPKNKISFSEFNIFFNKWARQDSNLRPTDYESVALTN